LLHFKENGKWENEWGQVLKYKYFEKHESDFSRPDPIFLDGKSESNTYYLISQQNYHGVMIEADPLKYNLLRENMKAYDTCFFALHYAARAVLADLLHSLK